MNGEEADFTLIFWSQSLGLSDSGGGEDLQTAGGAGEVQTDTRENVQVIHVDPHVKKIK